jgi:AcrR family transcriptional regulator
MIFVHERTDLQWDDAPARPPTGRPAFEDALSAQPPRPLWVDLLAACTMPSHPPLKPRKAPQQPRSQQTVAALLEAAAQVLETRGMPGFNTNAVAQRAGVSVGSLYQYFPSKEALTLGLVQREGEMFLAEAWAALEEAGGAQALRVLIAAAVMQQLRRPELARLLDVEESRPELRVAVNKGAFAGVLSEVLRRVDLPRQRDHALAVHDVGAMVRGIVDSAGERGESGVADLQRRVEAAVFGYLQAAALGPECESDTR